MTHSAKIIGAAILLTLELTTTSFAQQVYSDAPTDVTYVNNQVNLDTDNGIKTSIVTNAETEARFSALFPNASNQQWSSRAGNYWVSFLNNGRKANASFTPKGKMNYTITVCAMENLPAAFTEMIKNEYGAYSLFNAIEIKAHGAVVYHAVLENSKGFTTLKYTTEGIEVIQQIKKQ